MSAHIFGDNHRFKEIIKGRIRKDFTKYIKNHSMIGKQGNDIVKIPVPHIEIPRFKFDDKSKGGVASGDGEVGDAISVGEDEDKSNAGNDEGRHTYDAELTINELAQIFGETLKLQKLKPKNIGDSTEVENKKWSSVNRTGPDGLKIYKRTFRRALARSVIMNEYDYNKPVVIPRREDYVYKYPKVVLKPDIKVVIFYLMDVSGSMSQAKRDVVRTMAFWIDLWVASSYGKKIDSRFLVHDTTSLEIDREHFFKINTSGGTYISSVLTLCDDIINKDYDPNVWNIYVYQFSDGDNWNNEDNTKSINIIKELCRKVVIYSYCEINSDVNNNTFHSVIRRSIKNDNMRWAKIESRNQIPRALKAFFSERRYND